MQPVVKKTLVSELFQFKDKVVVITGAGGIGTCIAKGFADNGARVAMIARRQESLDELQEKIKDEKYSIKGFIADVTNKKSIENNLKEIKQEFGVIDIFVHTAGIARNNSALDFEEDKIQMIIQTNLIGTIFVNQAVAKVMAKQQYGKIINIGSIGGIMSHTMESMPYDTSKAGVHHLTKIMASELAKYHINVNAVAPTWILTPMMASKPKSYEQAVASATPFERYAESEELLGAIYYLSSDASNFVTGQILAVDGGWSASKPVRY